MQVEIIILLVTCFINFGFGYHFGKRDGSTKVGTPSASHNSVRAVICGACGSADVDEVYHCQTCDTKSVVSTVDDRNLHP